MSKMSQLHAELSEQAYDMGYQSLGEAEQMGCTVDWENVRLISPEESAHTALLHEKRRVITGLLFVASKLGKDEQEEIDRAIRLITEEIK